jgi:hypothetical protein
LELVDGGDAAAVEVKRIVLRLAAVAQQARPEHRGAKAGLVAHTSVEQAVAALRAQGDTDSPARAVVVRSVAFSNPAHVDQPRVEIGKV